ncbi:MAG: hypothetical protein ABSG43_18175, partial [Solirubrobacteraceae bacterium]
MFGPEARWTRRVFAPAAALMAWLKYAQKFVLIAIVLLAPLAFVVKSYLDVQSRDTAFAVKERVGLVYLKPVTELLARVVRARTLAVGLAAHEVGQSTFEAARAQVLAAAAAVDGVRAAGVTLGLTGPWATVKQQLDAVTSAPVTTPHEALTDYSEVTTAIESLIGADGNNSNMILDPDNDSYYIMDAVLNRLTVLIDSAGRAGDLQSVIASGGTPTLAKRLTLEDLKGTIATTLSNSDPDYASALQNTKDTALRGQLSGPMAALDNSLGAVSASLTAAVYGSPNGPAASRLASVAEVDAMTLDRRSLPALDHLLAQRIAGFDSN